jgi:hypothetical protein
MASRESEQRRLEQLEKVAAKYHINGHVVHTFLVPGQNRS